MEGSSEGIRKTGGLGEDLGGRCQGNAAALVPLCRRRMLPRLRTWRREPLKQARRSDWAHRLAAEEAPGGRRVRQGCNRHESDSGGSRPWAVTRIRCRRRRRRLCRRPAVLGLSVVVEHVAAAAGCARTGPAPRTGRISLRATDQPATDHSAALLSVNTNAGLPGSKGFGRFSRIRTHRNSSAFVSAARRASSKPSAAISRSTVLRLINSKPSPQPPAGCGFADAAGAATAREAKTAAHRSKSRFIVSPHYERELRRRPVL